MLKVKFTRIKNVVLMEVLEQSGIQRGRGVLYSTKDSALKLQSITFPELRDFDIFIGGREKDKDNKIASICLSDEEKAKTYVTEATSLVEQFNNSLKSPKRKKRVIRLKRCRNICSR